MSMCLKKWGVLALVAAALFAVSGCAQGELEDVDPEVELDTSCKGDEDCTAGLRCNVIVGECVRITPMINNSTGNNTTANNTTANNTTANNQTTPPNNTTANNQTSPPNNMTSPPVDMGEDMGMEEDMRDPNTCVPACGVGEKCESGTCVPDMLTCNPACGANEECMQGTCVPIQTGVCDPACPDTQTCENGTCVPATCNPGCEAGGTCTVNGCVYPQCQSEGAACDPSTTDQGSFYCLVNSADNRAQCYSKCPVSNSAQGCAVGQRCLAPVQSNPSIQICLDSECSIDSDCNDGADTGTCLKFENSWGFCEPDGGAALGATCNPSANQWCQQGLVCDTPSGGSTGSCEQVCDPWTGAGCGVSEYCSLYTTRSGVCTSDTDSLGFQAFEQCATPGDYCDDATVCLSAGQNNFCFKYCRPGSSDCSFSSSATCNSYIFPGEREIGLCDLNCMGDSSVCPTDWDCVNGVCRDRCTTATVVADCCGGNATNCNWQCVGGYCE
jgi:hypothetical protein